MTDAVVYTALFFLGTQWLEDQILSMTRLHMEKRGFITHLHAVGFMEKMVLNTKIWLLENGSILERKPDRREWTDNDEVYC